MKMKNYFLLSLILSLIIMSCGGGIYSTEVKTKFSPGKTALNTNSTADRTSPEEIDRASLLHSLDEMADLERSGSWIKGMAFAESGLRENAGDLAGAVLAAYKELSWVYGLGLIQKSEIENGLLNVLNGRENETALYSTDASCSEVTRAIIAFINERWNEAGAVLSLHFNDFDEPDYFGRWMILVCALEKNKAALSEAASSKNASFEVLSREEFRRLASAYKSIRARYAPFPEYWYRGARVFSGAIGADYAENCVNISPQGPFADECRKILASFSGLKKEDSLSIKTKREIESIISTSINSGNPQLLDPLLPLIGLPDNPFTFYAVNALRSLNSVSKFRNYFSGQAASSSGRLAERLLYISRS